MNKDRFQLGINVAFLGLLLYFGYGYAKEKVAEARAEAVTEGANRARAESKAEHDTAIKAIKDELAEVKNQKQAVKVIERYVPQAAPAATITKQEIAPAVAEKLPDSPGYTVRTESQEVALAQNQLSFETCKVDMVQCAKDKKQAELERDEWKKAAKGGSKFKRFVSGATKIGIGLGIGYALGKSH